MAEQPALTLHLETDDSIEVKELTAALGSLARQFHKMVESEGLAERPADARLLVSSVSRGSIDISLVPDVMVTATFFHAAIERYELVVRFAGVINRLMQTFFKRPGKATGLSVSDCEDVINIAKPIAAHGGQQSFYTVNGDGNTLNVLTITSDDARRLVNNAAVEKLELQNGQSETRQRVPMIWERLDREAAKTEGIRSPDKGLIEEIDKKPRAVLFTDDLSYLKREMIADEENPYRKVYFVDVEVSRIDGKVVSYRITGYHGKDDLD